MITANGFICIIWFSLEHRSSSSRRLEYRPPVAERRARTGTSRPVPPPSSAAPARGRCGLAHVADRSPPLPLWKLSLPAVRNQRCPSLPPGGRRGDRSGRASRLIIARSFSGEKLLHGFGLFLVSANACSRSNLGYWTDADPGGAQAAAQGQAPLRPIVIELFTSEGRTSWPRADASEGLSVAKIVLRQM
jgi:hypothetical protein